ncbi:glycerophosphodiester phosphodiesterase family protein [Bacteroides eggerthii]|uniref:glycerophosphodiester phosphodiesterase family protein n=1 Tax=Bacteroides eggerthii TaxID=28111 RepID=UPI0022E8CDB7|nr:glycerophosphodiester phosphodiesterase family protein [Bacteroides eggerthii]
MMYRKLFFAWITFTLLGCKIAKGNGIRTVDATISLAELFSPTTDLQSGIEGIVNTGGKIEIKIYAKSLNTLVYHAYINATSTTFSENSIQYRKEQLGPDATYYPSVWDSKDFKTALWSIDRKLYDGSTIRPYPFLSGTLDLKIEINEEKATLVLFKIPALGVINSKGGNAAFWPAHFCYDLKNAATFPYRVWNKIKRPRMDVAADVVVAAHRGFWGDNLGHGDPENSTGAFEKAKEYTDVLETDIMITKDKRMVISHDYSLSRLSDYSGPLSDYLFDLDSKVLKGLHLKRRDGTVSAYPYLFFEDIVDILLRKQMVLTVDIKDVRARYRNGVCIANCDYDPKTHGELAKKKIKESWMTCMQECIRIAKEKNALQYLAFKTPYTYDELKEYAPDSLLSKVLFMPVIQPKRTDFLEFTDGWIACGNKVIAYETNFLNERDAYLKPITKEGIIYSNLLEYVYKKTGLRSGCYPEEVIGPMGTVTRWVEWKMKYTYDDRRGDHYWLMNIPYGSTMIMTSDRPDVWKVVNEIYNQINN